MPCHGHDRRPLAPFPVSYDGTNTLATTPLQARQLEARYLYVLMCLTCDLNYLNGQSINGQTAGPDATARFIAQWAVNAVDFKSRSSIMTPFDYDPNFANPAQTHHRLESAGRRRRHIAFGAASGRIC